MEVVEIANYCVRTWVNLLLCKAANNFFSFLVLGISEKKGSKMDDGKLVKFIKKKVHGKLRNFGRSKVCFVLFIPGTVYNCLFYFSVWTAVTTCQRYILPSNL